MSSYFGNDKKSLNKQMADIDLFLNNVNLTTKANTPGLAYWSKR